MKKNMDYLNSLIELESKTGYNFKDKGCLILSMTHSSYANEMSNKSDNEEPSNERLEFLGDAVLGIIISDYMYRNYSELSEGEMTKARANIVCESSLADCAQKINIGHYLRLGKGEEGTGGRTRQSILSDAFEALIAAIYIDGGMENAKNFVLKSMKDMVSYAIKGALLLDYKTQLQEYIQQKSKKKASYRLIKEKGPDHDKTFVACVKINNKTAGTGEGKSKKEAEQNAARNALERCR
jgi:ribonuclease III